MFKTLFTVVKNMICEAKKPRLKFSGFTKYNTALKKENIKTPASVKLTDGLKQGIEFFETIKGKTVPYSYFVNKKIVLPFLEKQLKYFYNLALKGELKGKKLYKYKRAFYFFKIGINAVLDEVNLSNKLKRDLKFKELLKERRQENPSYMYIDDKEIFKKIARSGFLAIGLKEEN